MATQASENALVTLPKKYGKVILTLDNVLLPPEKISPSPSQQDGLSFDIETDLRILGCELIQTSGILLKLPQVAMAAGQVLFQRFYYAKSLVRYPMETTAMACIALASKIEEAPRKIRDVINVFNHVRQVKNGRTIQPVILDGNYITLKNQVIKAERRLLKEMGFCCHVKHPHKIIIMYLKLLEADNHSLLAQTSWNYMNDALRTDVFVRFSPETIACSCIWLAGRKLGLPLPDSPPWYYTFRITTDDVEYIAAAILRLYLRKKVKLETLESRVEEIRREQQEARLRKNISTVTPQTGINFSPGSRNNTPSSKTYISSPRKKNSSDVGGRREKDSSGSRSASDETDSRHSKSPHHRSRKKRRANTRSRSRSRGRSRSRDRSDSRDRQTNKKYSRSPSPTITPPPRFIKNKEKGPVVRSMSRSRSRSPQKNYDKYQRYERFDRHDRYSKNDHYDRDRHDKSDKGEKYSRDDKISRYDMKEKGDKYISKYEKVEKKKSDRELKREKKFYDNGYDKPHKGKKNGRHRSRSRDRRR